MPKREKVVKEMLEKEPVDEMEKEPVDEAEEEPAEETSADEAEEKPVVVSGDNNDEPDKEPDSEDALEKASEEVSGDAETTDAKVAADVEKPAPEDIGTLEPSQEQEKKVRLELIPQPGENMETFCHRYMNDPDILRRVARPYRRAAAEKVWKENAKATA